MTRQHIWIVSPASARANNGNWQSASRWARFLRTRYRVTISLNWPDADADAEAHANADARPPRDLPADPPPDLLIALHARRSASSLDAWTQAWPQRPSILLLTGTDLYRDIHTDASAQRSLEQASALVLLQPAGMDVLPAPLHAKASVIFQSAATLRPTPPTARRHADICMIGHLREEKDPRTFMRAAAQVTSPSARLIHIGGALEPALADAALATAADVPRYQWLGAMPHAATTPSDLMPAQTLASV